ncbi:MAG: dockerin type I repeat-containing protein [Gammaproteobacteria bacterium]
MNKFLFGLALCLPAAASNAQSVLTFDVVFDQVYEASGAFAPNLTPIAPGPFNSNQPILPPNLKAHVVMSAVPSGTQLTAVNTITLNGTFSTESGNSPSNGWSVHTFDTATFNLLKAGGNSNFAIDFVTNPNDWPTFIATSANGYLSDHGPAAPYPGATCPYFFGCASAQPAGTGSGAGTYALFASGTNIFNAVATFPTLANVGNYPLISGTYSQSNAGSGLGFDNGIDAFAFQGVLDTTNSQGNGSSQPYPDGVSGHPGIVRFLTFSTTGNTAYMVQGHIVPPIADTDVDSVANGVDNCPTTPNWTQLDSDVDVRGNACDNCTLVSNTAAGTVPNSAPVVNKSQLDSDSDGYGNACDADVNNSGGTTASDYAILRSVIGKIYSFSANAAKSDINASGSVTAADYAILRSRIGTPPGPSGLACAGTIPCVAP